MVGARLKNFIEKKKNPDTHKISYVAKFEIANRS